jgi:hypothetical protein
VGKKTGNFISATLFYNAANVTKRTKPNEGIPLKQNANKSNIMTLIFFLVVLN